MSAENVVINFVGDTTELQPVDDILDQIVQKGGAVGAQWKKTSDIVSASNKTSVESTNKLSKSIDQLAIAAKSGDKAVIGGAYKDYLKQIQTQLGLTKKELIDYVQNARQAAQAQIFDANTDEEIQQLTLSIEAMNDQLKELGVAEFQTEERTKSLKAQLRAMKEELAGLDEGTAEFEALKQKAGELDDKLKDVSSTVSNVGSDTKNIDGLISAVSGLAGGYAITQGAAALFGDGEEEVQKALLKVNAAMSILQGLQQIQNVLQKESAASLLITDLRTKALAIGQQFLTVTTLETALATNVLRGALLASGIGAIVVVLGLAAAAMDSFGSSTKDSAEDLKALNEEANNYYDSYLKIQAVSQLQINRDISLVKNQEQIKLLEAEGGNLEKIAGLKRENNNLELTQLRLQLNGIESSRKKASDNTLFTERELAIKSDIFRKEQGARLIDIELSKGVNEENKAAADEARRGREELQKAIELQAKSLTAQAEAEVARRKLTVLLNKEDSLSSINAIALAEIDAINAGRNERLKSASLTAGEIEKINAEADLAIAEKERQNQDLILATRRAGVNASLLLSKQGSDEELKFKLQSIDVEQAIALRATELTVGQIAEINAKAEKAKQDLIRSFNEGKLQDEISLQNAAAERFGILEQEKLKIALERLITQRDLEISQAQGNAAKIAEINAKFDTQTREAKEATVDAILAENIKTLTVFAEQNKIANQNILSSDLATFSQKVKASKDLLQLEEERFDLEHKALTEKVEQDLLTTREFELAYQDLLNRRVAASQKSEEEITALTVKEIEKRSAAIQSALQIFQQGLSETLGDTAFTSALSGIQNFGAATLDIIAKIKAGTISSADGLKELASLAIGTIQNIANQIFSESAATRQEQLASTIEDLNKSKEAELNNKNLTEQQKRDIEEKYKIREKQEKIKAFQADKQAKKEQAAINGFLAVTQALATNPFPYSLIVAAIVAASTAVQVAKINSTPIPKFKTGKVDIQGPGTTTSDSIPAMISRGESVIKADSTAKWKDALVAINNDRFESYLLKQLPFNFPNVPDGIKPNGTMQIDYNKLAEAVANKMAALIPAPAQIHNVIDKDGIKTLLEQGASKTEIKNKYFSMT